MFLFWKPYMFNLNLNMISMYARCMVQDNCKYNQLHLQIIIAFQFFFLQDDEILSIFLY
jgi:hypothetical protein